MLFKQPPPDFAPRFDIASCYIEHDGRFLMLHRQEEKSQGGKWGLPAGKVELGESHAEAVVREVQEESGINLLPEKLAYLGLQYVRYPDYDFIYHMYRAVLDHPPVVTLSVGEHQDYRWVTAAEALSLPLIEDQDACIRLTHLPE